jgi:hypothetical protein
MLSRGDAVVFMSGRGTASRQLPDESQRVMVYRAVGEENRVPEIEVPGGQLQ